MEDNLHGEWTMEAYVNVWRIEHKVIDWQHTSGKWGGGQRSLTAASGGLVEVQAEEGLPQPEPAVPDLQDPGET